MISIPVRRRLAQGVLALALAITGATATAMFRVPRDNPAYPASEMDIAADLARMRADPVEQTRPLVVLSGWRSPGVGSDALAAQLGELSGRPADRVLSMSYPWSNDIEPLGARVVAAVEDRWPSDDPARTVEVDVVASSMGGIVARWAAADRGDDGPRLHIRTLFTIAAPHRGARLADRVRVDRASSQLRAGSGMLAELDAAWQAEPYEIVPYAVLNDWMVGATRSAPPGAEPIWVPGRVGLSHHMASRDERIIADIARRLRGEEPLGEPSTPPRD